LALLVPNIGIIIQRKHAAALHGSNKDRVLPKAKKLKKLQ